MTTDAPRSVLITGASTGIGEACALWFDRKGYRVFAGIRRADDGERLRSSASSRLVPVTLDVTDGASISSARDTVARELGSRGLDGLVNNAGVAVAGALELVPIDTFRGQLEVNVVGQIAVTQAFLPLVRVARGRIVFMGSIGGRMSTPFLGPYCASKFALEAIADALRVELKPWGIEVAIIEPGSIATPIWDKSAGEAATRERSRSGEPDYAAALAAIGRAAANTGRRGAPPSRVAAAVAHALESSRPKTRYLIGRDARLRAWLMRFVPDRVRDRLIIRAIKLPS